MATFEDYLMVCLIITLASFLSFACFTEVNKSKEQKALDKIMNTYWNGVFDCEEGCLNQLEVLYGKPIPEKYKPAYMNCSDMCWKQNEE